jgi:hypothetical protein
VLVGPNLIRRGRAFAKRGHHAEDGLVADAAGDGRLRDGPALLRGGDVERHHGAYAGERDVLRSGPDKAALKGLFERQHGCAQTCSAEQEDVAERADAEVFRDAEREGGVTCPDDGEEVGHAGVVGTFIRAGKISEIGYAASRRNSLPRWAAGRVAPFSLIAA